ncbi:hypothetical protein HU200_035315 [Digitaria exilis]|uniref:rRNA N-glycosylase n=1 Tax=Digitaria exilis TaxID=1010633 RepID=A0A835BEQ0_9POAL|nr:hypothetical protein HU200_035315 [Digitaria exilis]
MESRLDRARNMSPKLIGPQYIPVTPFENPITGHSFHIIEMISWWKKGYVVDILVRDTDGYIVAFRRRRLQGSRWQQGTWYRYKDVEGLPEEIQENSVKLSFDSSHGSSSRTKPGGIRVLQHMFEVLATFQDCNRDETGKLLDETDEERVYEALLKAIIIFSEALRFRSIYLTIRARSRYNAESSELHSSLWDMIHVWGHSSSEILQLCAGSEELPALDTGAPEHLLNTQVRRPDLAEPVTLATLDDAIGSAGELMYLKVRSDLIMSDEKRSLAEEVMRERKVNPVPEPNFRDVDLPE